KPCWKITGTIISRNHVSRAGRRASDSCRPARDVHACNCITVARSADGIKANEIAKYQSPVAAGYEHARARISRDDVSRARCCAADGIVIRAVEEHTTAVWNRR